MLASLLLGAGPTQHWTARSTASNRIRSSRTSRSSPPTSSRAAGPGTPGEEKTVAYLTDQFRQMGLKPGNPDGTYRPGRPPGRLPGHAGDRVVPGRRQRDRADVPQRLRRRLAAAGAGGRRSTNSDVVFVGYGVVAPEYGWDDYKGLDVRGKTLVMLVNDPAVPDPNDPSKLDPAVFKGRAMTYYGRWTYKYEIASEKGAAAAILVHETGPAGYPFEVVRGSWSRENFDIAAPPTARRPAASPSRAGSPSTKAKELFQAARPGLRRPQEGRRPPRLPARAARRQGAVRGHQRAPRGPVAERRRQARGLRPRAQGRVRRLHRALGPPRPRPAAARATRSSTAPPTTPRASPRSSRSPAAFTQAQAAAEAVDPLPGRDRRGEGTARRQVLRRAPALSARTDAGRHQPGRDQPLGPDHATSSASAWATRRSTTCSSRSPQATAGRSPPTPSPRRATSTAPTTSSSPSRASPPSIPRGDGSTSASPPTTASASSDEYTEKDYHKVSDEVKPDWDLSGAVEDLQAPGRARLPRRRGRRLPRVEARTASSGPGARPCSRPTKP